MADEEIAYLVELRARTVETKRVHELQRASQGVNTPADVVLAIKSAELDIERIDARLLLLQGDPEVEAATGPDAGIEVLRHKVKQLGDIIRESVKRNREQNDALQRETKTQLESVRAGTQATLEWQNKRIKEVQSETSGIRREARETRSELRETLSEIREESRQWRSQEEQRAGAIREWQSLQERKHDTGARFYRNTLKLLAGMTVLALGLGVGIAVYLAVLH